MGGSDLHTVQYPIYDADGDPGENHPSLLKKSESCSSISSSPDEESGEEDIDDDEYLDIGWDAGEDDDGEKIRPHYHVYRWTGKCYKDVRKILTDGLHLPEPLAYMIARESAFLHDSENCRRFCRWPHPCFHVSTHEEEYPSHADEDH